MKPDPLRQTFIVESRELLSEMETGMLAIDVEAVDIEAVNAIFRAAHTIKGSASVLSFDPIVEFTHAVESVLDAMRSGELSADAELIALLLGCCDQLGSMIEEIAAGHDELPAETEQHRSTLMERLHAYAEPMRSATHVAPTGIVLWEDPEPAADNSGASLDARHDLWHISLRFGRDVLRHGLEPMEFVRYLGKLGTISAIVTLADGMPEAAEMDPEACYLGFEIAFQSSADKAAIEAVFDFVRDECSLRILPPHSLISEYIRLIEELPEETVRLGEILVRCGTLTTHELETALANQREAPAPAPPLGEILVEGGTVRPAVVAAALAKQQQVKDAKARESRSVRVDSAKLDALIDLVGELIIAVASSQVMARRASLPELEERSATVCGLVEQVRDSALGLRMVKIGATFSRFQRIVHDVSRDLGKQIDLVIHGEDTELDKTVVERITDPLTHLVRNSIDHGIEPPQLRTQSGKPPRAKIVLNAYHDSGCIVIEVSDDGRGLQRDKIRARAVERGLIDEARVLTDSDIYGLIFEPGFSTADSVTNLSGRGVGMDVVRRNITELRGSIEIESEPGVGTKLSVRLPLTLAIIDGFLIGLGKTVFVVALDVVEECIEFSAASGHDFTDLRGRVLPLIRLRELFGIAGSVAARQNIVVVRHGAHTVGLVVDSLLGEFQTVIKPMSKVFSHLKFVSGSTILGTGEVALILDVPALVQRAGHTLRTLDAHAAAE